MLQEASSADLEEVKKQLKKLPETKVLFKKDSTLADVPDVGKFLATLKFHLFNNRNLLDFAKSRTLPSTNPDAKYGHYAIKNVSAGEIAKYRQITADKIDEHDFQFKLVHAKKFLEEGSKVKAYVFFRGRTIVFKDRGEILLLRFTQEIGDLGVLESMPKLEGKRMIIMLNPKKGK